MDSSGLNELNRKIEEMILLCKELQQENRALRTSEQSWRQERSQLIEKNEMARQRVEAMIGRLRALESESWTNEILTTVVKILDKDYRISCPRHEEAALIESAHYLDSKMREIKSTGKVIGVDKIAVMAALNIAHELIQNSQHLFEQNNQAQLQITSMLTRLTGALEGTQNPNQSP